MPVAALKAMLEPQIEQQSRISSRKAFILGEKKTLAEFMAASWLYIMVYGSTDVRDTCSINFWLDHTSWNGFYADISMKSAPQEYSVSVSETDNLLQLTPPNLKGSEFWYF